MKAARMTLAAGEAAPSGPLHAGDAAAAQAMQALPAARRLFQLKVGVLLSSFLGVVKGGGGGLINKIIWVVCRVEGDGSLEI